MRQIRQERSDLQSETLKFFYQPCTLFFWHSPVSSTLYFTSSLMKCDVTCIHFLISVHLLRSPNNSNSPNSNFFRPWELFRPGLNLRPPAQQTGANPIELTARRKKKVRVIGSRLYNLLLDASSKKALISRISTSKKSVSVNRFCWTTLKVHEGKLWSTLSMFRHT